MPRHVRPLLALSAVCGLAVAAPVCLGGPGGGASGVVASDPEAPEAATDASLPDPPVVPRRIVKESWEQYKSRFIQADGRVIDRKAQGISTSEGQAYALLRAVWMDDQATFRTVLRWGDENLNAAARTDHLHAWKWGQRPDGSWGVIDRNSASDAEQLIAYALLMGGRRWKVTTYRHRAALLMDDLWNLEVRQVGDRRYLLPGDQGFELPTGRIRINPSYYLPFTFRAFDEEQRGRGWMDLVDTTYHVLDRCVSKVGLPTDWCELNPATGELGVQDDVYDTRTDFGYEAFRVLWNLAVDHRWHKDPRAETALKRMDWLRRFWIVRRQLPAVVTVDGIPRAPEPFLGLYGAVLPALSILDPLEADILYQQGILPTYDRGLWGDPDDYYLQNWVWFGLALQASLARPG